MLKVYWHKSLGGWQEPEIVPLENLSLHPAAKVFHYAIEVWVMSIFLKFITILIVFARSFSKVWRRTAAPTIASVCSGPTWTWSEWIVRPPVPLYPRSTVASWLSASDSWLLSTRSGCRTRATPRCTCDRPWLALRCVIARRRNWPSLH